jgi:hypothetical protein
MPYLQGFAGSNFMLHNHVAPLPARHARSCRGARLRATMPRIGRTALRVRARARGQAVFCGRCQREGPLVQPALYDIPNTASVPIKGSPSALFH